MPVPVPAVGVSIKASRRTPSISTAREKVVEPGKSVSGDGNKLPNTLVVDFFPIPKTTDDRPLVSTPPRPEL